MSNPVKKHKLANWTHILNRKDSLCLLFLLQGQTNIPHAHFLINSKILQWTLEYAHSSRTYERQTPWKKHKLANWTHILNRKDSLCLLFLLQSHTRIPHAHFLINSKNLQWTLGYAYSSRTYECQTLRKSIIWLIGRLFWTERIRYASYSFCKVILGYLLPISW